MTKSKISQLSAAVEKIKRLFRKEPRLPEEDPHAYVTAPKKPRPPYRSTAAVADKPEDWPTTNH
jgi:hypothetical protein